ncbi:sigma-70 family RNA polymerase sigma factor [Fictibacillus phosphorivorans]|uniref:sigma-70 family RNA polymerase sigma factor n=1 Tax=Fictibacillus phosphorivorans TaxID=1221500 RepID=UPI0012939592|nr:sigma-70 family RNA polymerase sigma factor [Fictibacillus phosphorivorans]MQR97598.1 sigma-70 family RNA polymerase sigma factor [Fictibacillus phosphorivorans]
MFRTNTVEKAKKGDQKAFMQLIDQEKEKLYRMAFMYVKNENDALDIVQDTVYKALISIKNIKDVSLFSTWITRILINTSLDFIKKKKKIVPIDQDFLERFEEDNQPSILEERLDLLHAINDLDEKYKTVVILRYYQDFTVKQIADILEYPEGTVKTTLHRAINKLRSLMKEVCINE